MRSIPSIDGVSGSMTGGGEPARGKMRTNAQGFQVVAYSGPPLEDLNAQCREMERRLGSNQTELAELRIQRTDLDRDVRQLRQTCDAGTERLRNGSVELDRLVEDIAKQTQVAEAAKPDLARQAVFENAIARLREELGVENERAQKVRSTFVSYFYLITNTFPSFTMAKLFLHIRFIIFSFFISFFHYFYVFIYYGEKRNFCEFFGIKVRTKKIFWNFFLDWRKIFCLGLIFLIDFLTTEFFFLLFFFIIYGFFGRFKMTLIALTRRLSKSRNRIWASGKRRKRKPRLPWPSRKRKFLWSRTSWTATTSEFTFWPIDSHLFVCLFDWLIVQPFTDRLATRLIDWLLNRLSFDWLIDRVIDWLIDCRIVYRLTDWLIVLLIDWLIALSIMHWYWVFCLEMWRPWNRTLKSESKNWPKNRRNRNGWSKNWTRWRRSGSPHETFSSRKRYAGPTNFV